MRTSQLLHSAASPILRENQVQMDTTGREPYYLYQVCSLIFTCTAKTTIHHVVCDCLTTSSAQFNNTSPACDYIYSLTTNGALSLNTTFQQQTYQSLNRLANSAADWKNSVLKTTETDLQDTGQLQLVRSGTHAAWTHLLCARVTEMTET